MKAIIDAPAPAKINLFLHVVGRRPDGRHNLQSVFSMLSLHDSLDFEQCARPTISREDACQPGVAKTVEALPQDDLCVKAARLLQAKTGCNRGVHIRLTKRIPTQAGLGGGSSDAATCLIALNRLWDTNLNRSALMKLAAELGADVPFFVFGQTAWAEGTGDQLQAMAIQPHEYQLIKPPSGIETARIFQHPELKRNTEPATIKSFAEHVNNGTEHQFGTNDLQPVAMQLCPNIGLALNWLKCGGLTPRMSGSGSTVFAALAVASPVVLDLPTGWFSQHCTSWPEHPLKNWVRF